MPGARDSDRMPITGRRYPGRDVPGVVFCRPDPIVRHHDGCELDPFAAGRAVVVEVQARMIDEDRQAAADQHRHEKEVEEMAVAHPERKTVRSGEIVREYLRDGWDVREPPNARLNPRRRHRHDQQPNGNDQNRRPDPDSKPPVSGIMNRGMRRVKSDRIDPSSFYPTTSAGRKAGRARDCRRTTFSRAFYVLEGSASPPAVGDPPVAHLRPDDVLPRAHGRLPPLSRTGLSFAA